MIRVEQNGLQWLEFELLANCKEVIHGVLTRQGGNSFDNLTSLNLGKTVGDNPSHVKKNRDKVRETFSLPHLFFGRQCHGTEIATVSDSSFDGMKVCDGLSTQSTGIGIGVLQADCQAAIFYDPINRALANVHCGWRGSVQNIYQSAQTHMQNTFNTKPEDLLVCLSPSLGPEHAEFIHYRTELPEAFWQFQVRPNYFDFWAISRWQLMQTGVLSDHIQIASIDTFANEDDYFSHRRSKDSGRQATLCALRP